MTSKWDGRAWSQVLADHFFQPEMARLPVLFFVDGEVLALLHPSRNQDVAIASLSDSVRRDLNHPHPHGYFAQLERRGRDWKRKGADGTPPFLHVLAVCVLAAARMGTGNVAPNNYRAHLCELLDVPPDDMPAGFRDSLYFLWDVLTWWLDVHLKGERGLSTITEDKHYTHIGYPISQTLFRGADARQLDDFFRWIQLAPGEAVETSSLIAYFRAWSPGRHLSRGARRLIDEPQFAGAIGGILSAYAKQWDGTRSSRIGSRRADLRVVYEVGPPAHLSLLAPQPSGYPARLQGEVSGCSYVAEAEDGYYVVKGAVDPRLLTRGVEFGEEGCSLGLAASEVHVLRLDAELGGWASVDTFVPGLRHIVLIAAGQDAAIQQLQASSSETVRVQTGPGVFGTWSVVRNVVIDAAHIFTGALAPFQVTHRRRFALRGGLPLASTGAYLLGGPPDVWLPTIDSRVALTVDGHDLDVESEQVRLAWHEIATIPGTHRLRLADAADRSIALVESCLVTPPPHEQPGHELEIGPDGEVVGHRVGASSEEGDVTVVGSHVTGALQGRELPPMLLKRAAKEAWLLGASPDAVLRLVPPRAPRWLIAAGLDTRLFEGRASFTVQFVIERRVTAPFLRIRQFGDDAPDETTSFGEASANWARLLLEATPEGPIDHDLLMSYRDVAQALDEMGVLDVS